MNTDELMALLDNLPAGKWDETGAGELTGSRANESIVAAAAVNYLRSDEYRRVREDAARLDFVLKRITVSEFETWIAEIPGNPYRDVSLAELRAAIDAAREGEG